MERLRAAALPGTNRNALDEEAAAEIERLRAELQHARDGLTKGRTRMREDLERHKPLVQAVEWLVEEGHMYPEDLARLRAALDGLRPRQNGFVNTGGPSPAIT